jgi:predicted transcriptional regulator
MLRAKTGGYEPPPLFGHFGGEELIVKPTFRGRFNIFMEAILMDKDTWQPKHHRSRIEIIADILRLLRLGNTGKIQITYYAYLRQDQASKYIDSLMEANLLEGAEEEMGLPSYRITQKGLTILSLIENLKEMLPLDGTTDILHRSKIVEINVGHVLVTKGVADLSRKNRKFAVFVEESLGRYRQGDWGEMSDEERQLNNQNLETSIRLFSSYESEGFPEIWITTEPDRSCSTIMFPDEDVSMEPREHYTLTEGVTSPEIKETF